MRFFRKAPKSTQQLTKRLGIFPGAFNPVTVAHLSIARAALSHVDEVVFVLPRVFPHKDYSGASLDDRLAMLHAASSDPEYSIAVADGGLYVDIARECRAVYGDEVRLACLCGRDAAERIAGWDYGSAGAFREMLHEFDLLVAARDGAYQPPQELAFAVRCLEIPGTDDISATDVRERALRGEAWEHLVPSAAHSLARRIYTQPQRS